jgi:hypothetical protein
LRTFRLRLSVDAWRVSAKASKQQRMRAQGVRQPQQVLDVEVEVQQGPRGQGFALEVVGQGGPQGLQRQGQRVWQVFQGRMGCALRGCHVLQRPLQPREMQPQAGRGDLCHAPEICG